MTDEESQRVSVVMPAYNEEAVIGNILERVGQIDDIYEIIVVDDCSKDKTAEIASQYLKVRVVRHPYNMGNGAAIKSGIRRSTGDIIVLMDSDGQHPPEEIPGLLQHIGPYDMVVGARNSLSEEASHRRFANNVFNWYASYIVGNPVPDLTSGFRAIKTHIAKSFVSLLPNGFSYPTTLTIALFRAGYAVKYQPFTSPARHGKSKIRPLKDGFRFLLTITRLAVLYVPLKIFLPVSLVMILSGGGYVILSLALDRRFSGFGGLVASMGLFLFMIGLVSEQIAMLHLSASEKKDY